MKKVNKEVLKDAANRLMFDMNDEEYDLLLNEFDIILKQMEMLGHIPEIDEEKPMTFPFDVRTTLMREDIPETPLDREEALKNAGNKKENQIKIPKVL